MTIRSIAVSCSMLFALLLPAAAQQPEPVAADDPPRQGAGEKLSVEELARRAKKSVVVITFTGRDGRRVGLGSGFVISADGLIATNLHVIGDARPIAVQLADGEKKYDVTEVYASERSLDLAVVKIDAKNLPALKLGNSDSLEQGQDVVAVGNPHGLKHSVVRGVVSGRRKIDAKPMIQLAIPIEPGNSGGPLLDADGRVQGILTMKSLVTRNLGFALEINALKPLLAKPNPVPMSRWLTIGRLDPRQWTTHLGARWRQRAGRILVEEPGDGFGGRSFALAKRDAPKLPYEATVAVKLNDETGAAGLIFEAHGEKHYGFYPTASQLRLTRFEGPDVATWTVLRTLPSKHYRPGTWNTLKVRVEAKKLSCYVNDQLVIESSDAVLRGGQVGLAKFRATDAEFKGFRVAKKLPPSQPSAELVERVKKFAADAPVDGAIDKLVEKFQADGGDGVRALRDRAEVLARQARQLQRLARRVHERDVIQRLATATSGADGKIDLFRAGLLISRLDNDEVEVKAYEEQLDGLAAELAGDLPKGGGEMDKLKRLNKFLFQDHGFHGSRTNYYNRSNSYLNEVLDDREGLPIALSVLYIQLARRLDLNVVGVGLPRQFMVKHVGKDGREQIIDVFDGGAFLTRQQAGQVTGTKLRDEHFQAATNRSILIRQLANLLGLAQEKEDFPAMLRYLDAILVVEPKEGNFRGLRAVVRFRTERFQAALDDCDWLLEHMPDGVDLARVRQLRQIIERARQSPSR